MLFVYKPDYFRLMHGEMNIINWWAQIIKGVLYIIGSYMCIVNDQHDFPSKLLGC